MPLPRFRIRTLIIAAAAVAIAMGLYSRHVCAKEGVVMVLPK